MNIKEIFEIYMSLSTDLSGHDVDTLMVTVIGNFVNRASLSPIFTIPVESIDGMRKMLNGSDKSFVLCYDGLFYIKAYYSHSDIMPLGRAYCFNSIHHKIYMGFLNEVIKGGLKVISIKDFEDIIDIKNYPYRLGKYLELKQNDMALSYFSGLVDGRVDRTSVKQAMYLSTKNCLICNKPINALEFSTVANAQSGVMVSFKFCKEHHTESLSYANTIEYVYTKLGCEFFCKTKPLTTEELLVVTEEMLKNEWNCVVESVIKNTITVKRESGVKIILRLDSLVNYAYIIHDRIGKEYCRYDSAKHHKIPYGPDHIHFKKTISSSYTTGIPCIDMKSIIEKVFECEALVTKL